MSLHASESGHWYTRTGQPMYEIKGANGNMRPTTLRDARKLDLVPSVTTIIKQAAAPGLERWKINQTLLAALTLPRIDGEPEDAYLDRIIRDSGEQARKAAERGTQIHAAIQGYYEESPVDSVWRPYVKGAQEALEKEFGEHMWQCEQSFAHPLGFGGKSDLWSMGIVGDIKTKEFDNPSTKQLAWDEMAIQLAAYREGLRIPTAMCFNLFVSTTVPGLCHIHIWSDEEIQRGWAMFRSLLAYWCAKNRIAHETETA
jgi:hypothetical protein